MVVSSFSGGWDSFRLGYQMGLQEPVSVEEQVEAVPGSTRHVNLRPERGYLDFPSDVLNFKDNSMLKARTRLIYVALPQDFDRPREVVVLDFLHGVLMFGFFIILIVLPVKFTRLVMSVKKEVIFHRKNINRTRVIGVLLILVYLFTVLSSNINFRINQILFSIPDYSISKSYTGATLLVAGIAVLIMAEILSKGLDMKSEQELTI